MIKGILIGSILVFHPIEQNDDPIEIDEVCSLTQKERDVILRQCEWATMRSMNLLEDAEAQLASLYRFNGKKTCQAAVQAAVTALAGATSKEAVIIAAITVVGRYLDDAVDGLYDAYYMLMDSRAYAKKADELEERLWMDY